jgi:peptidoglycan/xylan/chitin deacetylase (PgdA/CDA1 family)
LYLLTLEKRLATETSGNIDLRTKTSLILSQIPGWLDEAWDKKYKSGVISLAQELSEVNVDFLARSPEAGKYVIDFDRFYKVSKKVKHQAYNEGKNPELRYKFSEVSNFIEKTALKQYEEEFAELQSNPDKLMQPFFENKETREPKALDDLYPSADGHGHMSGKLVPENTWTMTFDDGPHKIHTEEMFQTLIQNKVPATFFWQSQNIKLYPQIVAKAKTLGFYRASHSMTHANLPTLKTPQLETEISGAAQVFESVVGSGPTLFRCPYGACGPMNSEIREIIAKNNMLHVHWSVDPLDWQDKNPQSIFDRTRKQIELRGKGIILFHDVHPQSVEAVKLLLPYMKSKKYRMVALPEMITEIRGKEKGPFYSP